MGYFIKDSQKDFYDLIKNNALENSNVCFNFYEYEGEDKKNITLTRKEVLEKSVPIAAMLKNIGIKKGDRIVIFDTQTYDNIVSVVASLLVGAIFTIVPEPIDLKRINRFISVVKSCEPKFILCSQKLENKANEILEKYKSSINNIKVVNIEECDENNNFIAEKVEVDDVIYIQYSSGSTSEPKGVMITYGNLVSYINCLLDMYPSRRLLGWVPFFHNMGIVNLVFGPIVSTEISVGVISTKSFLEKPIRWFECLSEFKADTTIAPNSVYEVYPKLVPSSDLKEKNIDISSIKKFISGSEIVSYETMKRFSDEYREYGVRISKFMPSYGLSEATCGAAMQDNYCKDDNLKLDFEAYKNGKLVIADDYKESIEFVPSGRALEKVNISIVNPKTLEKCKDDEFGEIWMKSPFIAKGYYKNEEATKESFKGRLKNDEGYFFRTGDLGIMRKGYLYITGRIKELIIINGKNILPNDIIAKLKERVPEIRNTIIQPFSVVRNKKEKLVIVFGASDAIIDKLNNKKVIDRINACVLEEFGMSPYEVGFINNSFIPIADNGKVSLMATARLYNQKELPLLNSNKMNSNDKVIYNTDTERILGEIIKKDFSVNAKVKDNLLNLGIESLGVVDLTTNIEKRFKVEIPAAYIYSNPTIEKIGQYIDRYLNGEDLSSLERDKSYLRDEVKLDENIKPRKYNTLSPEMKNIFVTGTTGFVGAYLIDTLIKETTGDKIYCHVRARDEKSGLERIKKNMEYYHLWNDDYVEYIIPVIGSLDKPLLGIEEEKYKYLAEHIDIIYHNGAILNFLHPYEILKETNVLGTERTLSLACEGKPKYYNYVSSYSVFDNPSYFNKEVSEDDPLEECRGYYLSYSESKWVAEHIISLAKKAGLRACIFRPGEITGSEDTGIWKMGDSVSRNLKSILLTGVYPDIDMNIHMTQVDYIAKAIVKISKKGEAYGKAYNLINPVSVTIKSLAEIIRKNGYKAEPISFEDCKKGLFNSGNEHPLKLLEPLYKIHKKNYEENFEIRYGKVEALLSTSNTEKILEGTGVKCEPMNERLISKYLNNFI